MPGPQHYERYPGAASAPLGRPYRRHEPERTLLYQLVQQHLETFLALQCNRDEHGTGLPRFVEREFERYLKCGILAHGFARVRCQDCKNELLVAYSCKNRGICPSCTTRRMHDIGAHLVTHVLPRVPYRQWVLSLPFRIRYLVACDNRLLGRILRIFLRAIAAHLRHKARRHRLPVGQFGAVTFIQRFGGSLNLNVHFHAVVADGLFSTNANGIRFQKLGGPKDEEVEALACKVARKVLALIEERLPAMGIEEEAPSPMSAAYERAIQGELAGIDFDHSAEPHKRSRRAALVDGFSVHANRTVAKRDRAGLERLCRYGVRPMLSLERLAQTAAGKVTYPRKSPSRWGEPMLELDPLEFLERLSTLIPPMRSHLVRYAGVLAPHSKLRPAVVLDLSPGRDATADESPLEAGFSSAGPRLPWAQLLRRVFQIDVLVCKECGGKMRVMAFLTDVEVTRTILAHLNLLFARPQKWPARAPPQETADQAPQLELEPSSDEPHEDWFPDPEPNYELD